MTALDRHRALLAGMTGSRWISEGAGVYVDEAYQWSHGPTSIASCTSYGNAALIAAAVNAYPAFLDCVHALKLAREFIANGIELGYIQMPQDDAVDAAHTTLPTIDAALAKLEAPQ